MPTKEKVVKRSLKFRMKDGTTKDFEIEKLTVINGKFCPFVFHLDLIKTGKCRLTISSDFNIKNLDNIEIVRDDG